MPLRPTPALSSIARTRRSRPKAIAARKKDGKRRPSHSRPAVFSAAGRAVDSSDTADDMAAIIGDVRLDRRCSACGRRGATKVSGASGLAGTPAASNISSSRSIPRSTARSQIRSTTGQSLGLASTPALSAALPSGSRPRQRSSPASRATPKHDSSRWHARASSPSSTASRSRFSTNSASVHGRSAAPRGRSVGDPRTRCASTIACRFGGSAPPLPPRTTSGLGRGGGACGASRGTRCASAALTTALYCR